MADVTEPTALNNQAPGLLKRIAVASPFFAYLIPTYILQVILAATHHWDIRTHGVAILRPSRSRSIARNSFHSVRITTRSAPCAA